MAGSRLVKRQPGDLSAAALSGTFAPYAPLNGLTNGEANVDRRFTSSTSITTGSGSLRGACFMATKTETITKVAVWSGGTAAGATPTLVRIGIWTVSAAGALTALVASIANDTTLLAAANTEYERALSASWNKVAGTRYFAGLLVVTGAAAPTTTGAVIAQSAISGVSPLMYAQTGGQTDLPATVTVGVTSITPYIEMRP